MCADNLLHWIGKIRKICLWRRNVSQQKVRFYCRRSKCWPTELRVRFTCGTGMLETWWGETAGNRIWFRSWETCSSFLIPPAIWQNITFFKSTGCYLQLMSQSNPVLACRAESAIPYLERGWHKKTLLWVGLRLAICDLLPVSLQVCHSSCLLSA